MDQRDECLKERTVAIVGGDLRTLYAARLLALEGCSCRLYGLGESRNPCDGGFEKGRCKAPYLMKEVLSDADLLLLPVPLSRDGKTVNAPLSSMNLPLSILNQGVLSSLPVFGGGLELLPKGEGGERIDLLRDPLFAKENALPTAEAALGLALLEHPGVLFESNCAILGYGNIASALLPLLRAAGARCTVFARREEARLKARAAGAQALCMEELCHRLPFFDILFNTVPAEMIDEEHAPLLKRDALYIELASAPFGMCEKSRGLLKARHLFAPALPGRYAPLYGGRLIAQRVSDYLKTHPSLHG